MEVDHLPNFELKTSGKVSRAFLNLGVTTFHEFNICPTGGQLIKLHLSLYFMSIAALVVQNMLF